MQRKRWQLFFEIHPKTKLNKIRKYLCRMPFLTVWLKICCQIRLWFVSRDRTAKNRNLLHSFLKDIQRTRPAGIPAGRVSLCLKTGGFGYKQDFIQLVSAAGYSQTRWTETIGSVFLYKTGCIFLCNVQSPKAGQSSLYQKFSSFFPNVIRIRTRLRLI